MNNIVFHPLTKQECTHLHQWLQMNHVIPFWDDGDREIEQVYEHYLKNDNVKRYLFFIENEPAGYIQSYSVDKAHSYFQFALSHQTNIGIDFFIGNPKFLGKKLSLTILEQFIFSHCEDADRIIVDPTPTNNKAIHVYKKYGFIKIGTVTERNKLYDIMAINLRRTSRAILLNEENKIFLIKIIGGPTEDKKRNKTQPFWITLGGKIEKHESAEEALKRELHEEAGINSNLEEISFFAFGEQTLLWNAFPTRMIEKFYLVKAECVFLHKNNLTEEEVKLVKEYRWWSIAELNQTNEIIYPPELGRLIENYLMNTDGWNVKEIPLQ